MAKQILYGEDSRQLFLRPLGQVLAAHAQGLRERQRLHIVEEGGKATVRMLLPVALLILPALFVVVLVPAAVELTRWPHDKLPTQSQLDAIFRESHLSPNWWSNGPGDVYGAHSHSYHKVLFCVDGGITFRIELGGRDYELHPGDRLDIPRGTSHSAVVGPEGVTCVEAQGNWG